MASFALLCRGDNILLDDEDHIKIVDYGCARSSSGAFVSVGTAKGALLWRAPETMAQEVEAGGEKCSNTPASDMWSAGLMLYELAAQSQAYCLRGRLMPVRDWQGRVMIGRSPEEVQPVLSDAHPVVLDVMRRCMQLDPARRITASAAFDMLSSATVPSPSRPKARPASSGPRVRYFF